MHGDYCCCLTLLTAATCLPVIIVYLKPVEAEASIIPINRSNAIQEEYVCIPKRFVTIQSDMHTHSLMNFIRVHKQQTPNVKSKN